jgi:hypothetical protein
MPGRVLTRLRFVYSPPDCQIRVAGDGSQTAESH